MTRRRTRPEDRLDTVLCLPPFTLARRFLEIAQVRRTTEVVIDGGTRQQALFDHIQTLDVEAQCALLAMPEALVGLGILESIEIPRPVQRIAEELAYHSRQWTPGANQIDDAWISSAIEICRHPWPEPSLCQMTFAESFYSAARYFLRLDDTVMLKNVHGRIYPDLNTLDGIFSRMDRYCREVGGFQVLSWLGQRMREKRDAPRDLLINYATKHLRHNPRYPKSIRRLDELVTHFFALMRFDHHKRMNAFWGEPAYIVEEMARTVLEASLVGVDRWDLDADIAVAEHVITETGRSVSNWEYAKHCFRAPLGSNPILSGQRPPAEWVHVSPEPNSRFGGSLRSALKGNLTTRPVMDFSGDQWSITPQTSVSSVVWEVQERLGLTPRELGLPFEKYIRAALARYGDVLHGDYYRPGSKNKAGDIDALLETPDGSTLLIFECKAMTDVPAQWSGGYHATLDYLRRVFLKSQEQLLRFERFLCEDGAVEVGADRTRLQLRATKVLRVTVCMGTFGDLHAAGYSGAVLAHFCSVQLSTEPQSSLPGNISSLQAKIQEHLAELKLRGRDIAETQKRTVFLDLPMFAGMVKKDTIGQIAEAILAGLEKAVLVSRVVSCDPE